MYQITYQKRNGELIYRTRNSLPGRIGDETSMGWIITNIQREFKGNYYNLRDYRIVSQKYYKKHHMYIRISKYIKKYSSSFALIIFIVLYLMK